MKMKSFFKNLKTDDLAKGGIIVGIVTAVIGTAADIVDKVRHDKREDKLYAKLTIKADEVPTSLLGYLDTMNEIRDGDQEES